MIIKIKEICREKCIVFWEIFFFPALGGGEYFVLSLLKDLKSLGYDCSAVCYADPATDKSFLKEESVVWDGIPVDRKIIKKKQDIVDILVAKSPDLVVTQSFDAPVIVDIAKEMGIKTILGTHFWRNICGVTDSFTNMLDRPINTVNVFHDSQRVFRTADKVYVNSQFMKKAVKKYVGIDVENVIQPMLDIERVVHKGKKNPKYITLINPDAGKGGALFASLAKNMPEYDFLCVGLGNEIIKQNRLINDAIKTIPNIKLIEKTDSVSEIYAQTKIMLVPSYVDETFSMVVLEAMANGIPVIGSPNGNLPYLIGEFGVVIDPDDHNEWGYRIREMCSDNDEYNKYSLLSIENSKNYNPEDELNKFQNLVFECIGEANES